MRQPESTSKRASVLSNKIYRGIGLNALLFLGLTAITWVILALDLDLKVSGLFFSEEKGWIYKDAQPWRALYLYGTIPGLALTLGALTAFFFGFIKSRWQAYQKQMLILALTSIVGAGILVNGILKPYCGRPRPREVIPFNGQWEFTSPCFNNAPGKGLSFPCGHCTMAFLFVTLIYLRRQSPAIAYGGAIFGLVYGGLMGITRAVQGAHFVTDTLWAFGVLTMVSLLLHYILIPLMGQTWLKRQRYSSKQIAVAGICTTLVIAIITIVFLTRRPYYEMSTHPLLLSPSLKRVVIFSNVPLVKSRIDYKERPPMAALVGQGFGWPNADETVVIRADRDADTLKLKVEANPTGYFAELRHQLFITLPTNLRDRITIEINPAGAEPLKR